VATPVTAAPADAGPLHRAGGLPASAPGSVQRVKDMRISAFAFAVACVAHAQEPIPCNTFHVDPVRGNDTWPGTWTQPLQTLTAAAAQAAASAGIDTIVLFPGLYETLETWPLTMPAGVSIQGTSALNTVLRSQSFAHSSVLRFQPSTPTAYDDVVVDGVTILAYNRCVEIVDADVGEYRVRANPTIANCFLSTYDDVTSGAVDMLVTPGGTPYPGHDVSLNGLVEHRPKIVNCTFVRSRIGVLNRVAQANSVGESQPGLLNCLFSNNTLTDLEGIDAGDVITCAFATANAGGLSAPIGAPPNRVFDTATFPPRYVETDFTLVLMPIDLRLRPGSPAIDVGSMPALAWPNGTTGNRFFGCSGDIFDADCEGYGNVRVARNGIDIGADESAELIIAGYQRGTTRLNFGNQNPFPNNQFAIWLNPYPPLPAGNYDGSFAINSVANSVGFFWLPWDPQTIHGLRGLRTTAATATSAGTLWMDLNGASSIVLSFTSPTTPLMLPIVLTSPDTQLNWQALPYQGSATSVLTNLQTLFVTP
jgi:hypothetical protein